jgi:hypothetical protein
MLGLMRIEPAAAYHDDCRAQGSSLDGLVHKLAGIEPKQ